LIQSGTALTVGVGQRSSNTVNITDGGSGAATVEWNGRAPHSVMAFQAILVQAATSRRDRITINLGSSTALATAGATTAATPTARTHSQVIHALRSPRTGPIAVQTGTVLDINVTARKINQLAIENWNFGHMVQAQWSGSGVHTFTDVSTIIVVIRNGTNDFLALDNAVVKGP
jgi:hypothetical protein